MNLENLITILQKAQDTFGYLSPNTLFNVAEQTNIPLSKVYGVATFYSQFRLKPAGKHHIHVCQGTACHVNGSAAISAALREHLNIENGGTTQDGLFTLTDVACIGCCSLSPAMMTDGVIHGSLNPAKAVKIVTEVSRCV